MIPDPASGAAVANTASAPLGATSMGRSFGDALASALDGAKNALEGADASAALVAAGKGDVVTASVARAKADVVLEIVSTTAARISGAINSLLQTQV
jgi:flagellar hook-basal body complex protein FliE